jgi:hypothetical protein
VGAALILGLRFLGVSEQERETSLTSSLGGIGSIPPLTGRT